MGSSEYPVDALECMSRVSRIVVYTSSGCQRCTMLKQWLKNRGKEFEEKDLENIDVMADLVMKNAVVLSAPALEVGETVYREDQIFDGNGRLNGELLRILEGK